MDERRYGSLPAVLRARRYALALTLWLLATCIAGALAAVFLLDPAFAGTFWGITAMFAIARWAYRRIVASAPIEDLLIWSEDGRLVEAQPGDDGVRGHVREAVACAARRIGSAMPKVYVFSGNVGPVAFSRWDRHGGAVVINALLANKFPACIFPIAAHEVAHLASRDHVTMRRIEGLFFLSVHMALGAGVAAIAAIVAGSRVEHGILSWPPVGYAIFLCVMTVLAVAARNAPTRLSRLHEFAADAVAAESVGSGAVMALTLLQLSLLLGGGDPEGGPGDSHPSITERVAALMDGGRDRLPQPKHRP